MQGRLSAEVFITTNGERPYFINLTKRAIEQTGVIPMLVRKPMMERYYECERLARGKIYIMCDDDCVPATDDTLDKLVKLMLRNPQLSQLGVGWKQDMQGEEDSSWRRGTISEDIWEFDHCGGIVAIRKGTIKDLGYKPDYKEGIGDDKIAGKIARELGYKVGIAHKLWFHHLGAGKELSTVWNTN